MICIENVWLNWCHFWSYLLPGRVNNGYQVMKPSCTRVLVLVITVVFVGIHVVEKKWHEAGSHGVIHGFLMHLGRHYTAHLLDHNPEKYYTINKSIATVKVQCLQRIMTTSIFNPQEAVSKYIQQNYLLFTLSPSSWFFMYWISSSCVMNQDLEQNWSIYMAIVRDIFWSVEPIVSISL
jgi:uncharacterized membrane protein